MLVTKKAPDFTATAVLADGSISEDFNLYKNIGIKGAVLFFWPLDFTFVCPSEIIAFSNRVKEFEDRGIQVIGCSVDSQFSHFAWRETPVENGGIGRVKFPMVADITKQIAKDYDVLFGDSVALRGSFLIDKETSKSFEICFVISATNGNLTLPIPPFSTGVSLHAKCEN